MDTNEFFQAFLMELLHTFLPVIVIAITGFVVALLERAYAFLRTKIGSDKLSEIERVVGLVVAAAEQSGYAGKLRDDGAAKKAWAIAEAQRILNERGFKKISAETIATMIESAVGQGLHRREPPSLIVLDEIPK